MNNKDIIAKIKTEIERLKAKYRRDMYKLNREGLASGYKIEAYNELLPFLSTLEESEKPVPNDLEEASSKFATHAASNGVSVEFLEEKLSFQEGAKWQAEHTPLPEDTVLFNKGVEEGKRLMMEEAVEADVNTYRDLAAGKSWAEFVVEMPTNNLGDKVRVIILPKED